LNKSIEVFPKLRLWETSFACQTTLKFAVLSNLWFATFGSQPPVRRPESLKNRKSLPHRIRGARPMRQRAVNWFWDRLCLYYFMREARQAPKFSGGGVVIYFNRPGLGFLSPGRSRRPGPSCGRDAQGIEAE
jgi:hypothetical protein